MEHMENLVNLLLEKDDLPVRKDSCENSDTYIVVFDKNNNTQLRVCFEQPWYFTGLLKDDKGPDIYLKRKLTKQLYNHCKKIYQRREASRVAALVDSVLIAVRKENDGF